MTTTATIVRQLLAFLWALPYTLVGVSIGVMGLCTRGHVRRRGRVLEFYGGGTKWFVNRLPDGQFVLALTLGHTIIGQTEASLDVARKHELVHVRQYEVWGPLMGPAYLLASVWMWVAGRDPYTDNPFERQAYEAEGEK
ncbi:MAG: hypothetical protein NXI04_24150 [Planctomycetaceae bacterium]|nr:hypothetical protein [Planctomycetaceae bacterium]